MIRHYFKIAFRHLKGNKFYSFINISGFMVGMVCAILLGIYWWHETSYDSFHQKKDRIYLVGVQSRQGDEEEEGGWTTPPMGPALYNYFPEIESFTRLCFWFDEVLVEQGDVKSIETGIVGADSSIFEIFTIPFIAGNPENALKEPNSVVITEKVAEKYFGEENPLGQTLKFNHFFNECVVTGVVENYPDNSHFDFEILLSLSSLGNIGFDFQDSWMDHTFSTYVLLREHVNPDQVTDKLDRFLRDKLEPLLIQNYHKSYDEYFSGGNYYRLFLEPLEQVHLSTLIFENREGKKFQTYAIGIVGIVILLLAIINYINLSTAVSITRTKEIGIRKTLGSGKGTLVFQYLTESILSTTAGLFGALILLELIMPYFNNLTGNHYSINYHEPFTITGLFAFAVFIGLIGGLYPAFAISSFRSINLLGKQRKYGKEKVRLRNGLVIFQLVICMVMIISTITIYKQVKFMQHKSPGFDMEQILVIKRPGLLNSNQEIFKQRLLNRLDVMGVSFVNTLPGRHFDGNGQHFQGDPADHYPTVYPLIGDADILTTLNLEVMQGNGFNPDQPGRKIALINESAVNQLNLGNPVGMVVDNGTMGKENYTISGIVKNFHFQSYHHRIDPLVIFQLNQLQDYRFNYILIKTKSNDLPETVASIGEEWKKLSNHNPYDYTFLDQDFNRLFQREKMTASINSVFSMISVFIACLGLMGLISHYSLRRTKEIGIRKIVGASVSRIVFLLGRDLLKWLGIAFMIGIPLSWYLVREWLQNFAYRTGLDWWIFLVAGLLIVLLAIITVSYQTIKAALTNPVEALRYE